MPIASQGMLSFSAERFALNDQEFSVPEMLCTMDEQ